MTRKQPLKLLLLACMLIAPQLAKPVTTSAKMGTLIPVTTLALISLVLIPVTTILGLGKLWHIFHTRHDNAKNLISKKENIISYTITITTPGSYLKRMLCRKCDLKTFTTHTALETVTLATDWIGSLNEGVSLIVKPSVRDRNNTDYYLTPIFTEPAHAQSVKDQVLHMLYVPESHYQTYGKRMFLWTLPLATLWTGVYFTVKAIFKSARSS